MSKTYYIWGKSVDQMERDELVKAVKTLIQFIAINDEIIRTRFRPEIKTDPENR